MRDTVLQTDHEEAQPKIIDLAGLPLEALLSPRKTALADAMRRMTDELIVTADHYAAHGSTPMQ